MATATVLAPTSHYPSQTSFSNYTPSGNMVSGDSRRSGDEGASPRQSLPSISEVISSTARQGPYPPPTHSMQSSSGLPSPFQPSRSYAESEKRASPQTMHLVSFPSRPDPLPAFSESPRSAFSGHSSLPPMNDRRHSPTTKHDYPPSHLPEPPKQSEPHSMNGSYPHHQQPPHAMSYQHSQQVPPGQAALPRYPISPRHGQYDHRGQPMHPEEAEYASRGPGRNMEGLNYHESLSRIGSSSRTIFNFAEAYARPSPDQHPGYPERVPTDREINEMLSNVELIKRSLEQTRDAVHMSIQSERAREGTKMKGPYDEDQDVNMYGDGMKTQFGVNEVVKKRRGRAAPPGRCHSCNRIDTPEWRRGPDGARTLCNACGLHYAKLERKRLLEARSLRPKPDERN